jgi:hypothetical protein
VGVVVNGGVEGVAGIEGLNRRATLPNKSLKPTRFARGLPHTVRLTFTLYMDEEDQAGDLGNYAKTILDELQPNVLRGDKDIGELVVRRIGWRRKDKLTICLGWESQG